MNFFKLATIVAFTFGIANTVQAFELGNSGLSLDNEIETKYNMDSEETTMSLESGMSYSYLALTASIDADFDIKNFINSEGNTYQGIDLGVDYTVNDWAVVAADTGLDMDNEVEPIVLSITFSF